jgi:ubiquinone/menaquinone biosynthesis C-methylase UbiE
LNQAEIKNQWERAAPGWSNWEETVANWIEPATEAMFDMAGVVSGAKVLDLACGAGSQTLSAALRVGVKGHVTANDISSTMLQYVIQNARKAKLNNISTIASAAEELELPGESLDAAISRLALMLFVEPAKVLTLIRQALKPGCRAAVVVFTVPEANAFMAKPMHILLRHAKKEPPAPGQPGIFSLGKPGILEKLFSDSGFRKFEQRIISIPLKMSFAQHALEMIQEAFGAYRAVVSDCSEDVKRAAWAEVADTLKSYETSEGFEAPAEVVVGSGMKGS